jgi:hypothetical protein
LVGSLLLPLLVAIFNAVVVEEIEAMLPVALCRDTEATKAITDARVNKAGNMEVDNMERSQLHEARVWDPLLLVPVLSVVPVLVPVVVDIRFGYRSVILYVNIKRELQNTTTGHMSCATPKQIYFA